MFWALTPDQRSTQLTAWLAERGTIRGGAPDPVFDQISSVTLADMRRDSVQDNFFVDGAWQQLCRYYGQNEIFPGGTWMQEPFMYDRVDGGGYFPGSDVVVNEKQILSAMQFPPRFYKENLPFNEAQTEVINAGPAAAVSIWDAYHTNAVMSMSTDLNIDAYQHGQQIGTGVAQARTQFIDGMDEAMSDGINPGWLGNYYTTYGNATRNGVFTNTLNSVPLWSGDQAGNPGQANWGQVMNLYQNCIQPPDTLLSNKALWTYLWNREETKQRFASDTLSHGKDERIGLSGFKLLDAYYHIDKLAPSTKFGTLLPSGLSQTTGIKPQSFTLPSLTAAQTAISGYPSGVTPTINPGEILFALRMQDWKFRPTNAPGYNHYFTPLIRSQQNADLVVQFYRLALNWYTPSPRDNGQSLGFSF